MNKKIRAPARILEAADFVEGEEANSDWPNDAAKRNSAEAITRVPRVGAFAIVARHK